MASRHPHSSLRHGDAADNRKPAAGRQPEARPAGRAVGSGAGRSLLFAWNHQDSYTVLSPFSRRGDCGGEGFC